MDNKRVDVESALRTAGLRLTDQRLLLGRLLFTSRDRHVTAEELYNEALELGSGISVATIYNTLNRFTAVGLLREVAVSGRKTYFDTNTDNHCHFYLTEEARLIDAWAEPELACLPETPTGTEISRVDIVIHLKPSHPPET